MEKIVVDKERLEEVLDRLHQLEELVEKSINGAIETYHESLNEELDSMLKDKPQNNETIGQETDQIDKTYTYNL